jgi:hypothetical protein
MSLTINLRYVLVIVAAALVVAAGTLHRSWRFASLFGSTIKAVPALTLHPILILTLTAIAAFRQGAKTFEPTS